MASFVRRVISTAKAPAAVGPYSQAVAANNTLYISGQIGFEPSTMVIVPGGAAAEAEQALKNMGEILAEAGASFNNVVKTTVLLKDIADYDSVNKIYSTYFSTSKPARAAYQVAALPKGALVEIEAIAILGNAVDADMTNKGKL